MEKGRELLFEIIPKLSVGNRAYVIYAPKKAVFLKKRDVPGPLGDLAKWLLGDFFYLFLLPLFLR